MKKNVALFIVAIFFLAQFGRLINFCICSMTVYQQTKSFACDCERQLFAAILTDNHAKDQKPQTIQAQQTPEDLFQLPPVHAQIKKYKAAVQIWPQTGAESLCCCFRNAIFHRPTHFGNHIVP